MRKLRFFLFFLSALFYCTFAIAQETGNQPLTQRSDYRFDDINNVYKRNAIGYRLAFVNLDDDNDIFDDIEIGQSLSYIRMLTENFGFEIEASLILVDDQDDIYSLFGDFLLKYPINDTVPFIRFGGGFQDQDIDDSDFEDTIAARMGAGIEYFISNQVSIDGEILYVFSGDATPDSWQYRAGVKYYFD